MVGDVFGSTFGGPSAAGDGTVYFTYQSGVVYALEGETGRLLSEYNTDIASQATPVILPGMLIVLTGLKLFVFRDASLEADWLQWARELGDPRADPRLWDLPWEDPSQEDS